ncbi:hypothetical protein AVEN_8285-1 [Araneus ventricosus]|uniref:Uncharacterized protein n=1 Tax=Araneus ventricosus TaxID=182803 RepID=A0A4Y2FFB9_ARAVE|nr:hypothetical protein AVEN_8285-1 [Araneus ventricosus]
MAWNESSVSKHIENPPVLVINNSLIGIGFDEKKPQNMKTVTMKKRRDARKEITIRTRQLNSALRKSVSWNFRCTCKSWDFRLGGGGKMRKPL